MSILANKQIKTTGQAINDLNEAVMGMDPVNGVLARTYNSQSPVQDRLDVLEETAAGLLVTKYIGPVPIVALGVPVSIGGQAALDLLDAMLFAALHPNDKKAIGLIVDVPASVVNDPVHFPNATNVIYTLTLTVFAGQEDVSGNTVVRLQGDSPEYDFEIITTINFNAGSYAVAPLLTMKQYTIIANNVLVNGGATLDAALVDINDNKANKVVGGIFDGMDLKPAAEKLNNDKQDKIIDTGWQYLSLLNGWENYTNEELQIRKIGNLVEIRGRVNATNATSPTVAIVPVGYRDVSDNISIAFGAGTIMRRVIFYSSGGIDIVKESGDKSLRIHFIYMI